MHRTCRSVVLAFGLPLITALSCMAAGQRIVAIGDVHGDLPDFIAILQQVGLMNENHQWSGGATLLVQVGDMVDRGPKSRECLDLLMELERQAPQQNGKVVPLLGNHEVMTMMGDLRYASAEDYQGFATPQSEKVRQQAYQEYLGFLAAHGNHTSDAASAGQREKWMAEHPLGFFERRDAFGPQGVYGRWLRPHDAVIELANGAFLHGGLSPNLQFRDIQELNQRMRSDLATFDSLWEALSSKKIIWRYMKIEEAIRQAQSEWSAIQLRGQVEPELKDELQKFLSFPTWFCNSPDSPIWYRGLALEPEEKLKAGLDAMLARLKIGYIVAGHTVRPKGVITQRFDNRVFLIDTGMLKSAYAGKASALEIHDGQFTAWYAGEKPQVLVPPSAADSSTRPSGSASKSPP
jgi:Calcineurin-like phosphoesterase